VNCSYHSSTDQELKLLEVYETSEESLLPEREWLVLVCSNNWVKKKVKYKNKNTKQIKFTVTYIALMMVLNRKAFT